MQDLPLTINWLLARCEQYFGAKTVTTRTVTGLERMTYAELAAGARRLASALDSLGIGDDGRVGTFAWNTARHTQLYFALRARAVRLHG